MLAIRFESLEQGADGVMLLDHQERVRALRGEIPVCQEYALKVLEAHQIPYEKLPYANLNESDVLRDTPTSEL